MKRDKYDKLFSDLIREAYDWTCCRCGKYYPEGGSRQGLHCSHIFSRRNKSTRWHVSGAVAHCFACHQWWGSNPILASKWIREFMGRDRIDGIERLARLDGKAYNKAKDEIYAHNKKELERVKKLRKEGVRGVVELIPWEPE